MYNDKKGDYMISSSPTYYVLHNVSTCPITVPLQDYCREHEVSAEVIKKEWNSIEQINSQGNEQIILCFQPTKWLQTKN